MKMFVKIGYYDKREYYANVNKLVKHDNEKHRKHSCYYYVIMIVNIADNLHIFQNLIDNLLLCILLLWCIIKLDFCSLTNYIRVSIKMSKFTYLVYVLLRQTIFIAWKQDSLIKNNEADSRIFLRKTFQQTFLQKRETSGILNETTRPKMCEKYFASPGSLSSVSRPCQLRKLFRGKYFDNYTV